MLANYHTHTIRCHHAQGSEREYIEKAISEGFKILGFSDHVPLPFKSPIRMDMDEIEDYVGTLLKLKEEYKDRIDILIGYEVEYTTAYFEKMYNEITKYHLDYLIQGQHFVPDEIHGYYCGEPTSDESRLRRYVDFTIEGMKTGIFTYLAHPDLINFKGDDVTYLRHMERLIAAAIDLDIPLEVNMYGFDDRRNYPYDVFFKTASKMGAKFVVGCDAHRPGLVVQPENLEGFSGFLKNNDIKITDNVISLVAPV